MTNSYFFQGNADKNAVVINSNFTIIDNANIFSNLISFASFNLNNYSIEVGYEKYNSIKLLVYTFNSIEDFNNYYKNLPIIFNTCILFIFNDYSKYRCKLRMDKNIMHYSNFKSEKDIPEISLDKSYFTKDNLSIKQLIDLFKPEFHINLEKYPEINDFIEVEGNPNFTFDETYLDSTGTKLDFSIALFFDGTANNKYNSELVHDNIKDEKWFELSSDELFEKLKSKSESVIEKHMIDTDSGTSYMNSSSNIALMYDLHKFPEMYKVNKVKDKSKINFKYYGTGIGTGTELKDDGTVEYIKDEVIYGQGADIFIQGTAAKLFKTCNDLSKKIIELSNGKEINSITFDTFGFSRGAALSLLFHNEVLKPPAQVYFPNNVVPVIIFNQFESNFKRNKIDTPIIKFRFVGLYDTVFNSKDPEFNSPIPLPNTNIEIKRSMFSLEKAKDTFVMEIQAKDEIRMNFPFLRSKAPNLLNLKLYGSHSDIGGSYPNKKYKTLIEHSLVNSNELFKLKKEFNQKFSLFFDKNSIYRIETTHIKQSLEYGYFLINERKIKNEIALISLMAMIEKYRDITKSENKYFENLKEDGYNDKAKFDLSDSYIAYRDWVNSKIKNEDKEPLKNEFYYDIQNRFIHISDNYNSLLNGFSSMNYIKSIVNKPNTNRKREIIK